MRRAPSAGRERDAFVAPSGMRAKLHRGGFPGVEGSGFSGFRIRARTGTSSTSAAWPSFSGRMWSGCAIGRQCSVFAMNSMSSRSTSRTTRIFAFAWGRQFKL